MTESEQAQAIAEIQKYSIVKIKERDLLPDDHGWVVKYADHKAIVDSQAQKISEQAAEIERLKGLNDIAERARINSSLNEYYRKSL